MGGLDAGPVERGVMKVRDALTVFERAVDAHDLRVELRAGGSFNDLPYRGGVERWALRPGLSQGRDRIGESKNPGAHWDLLAREPVGIPAAVPPLVVMAHQGSDRFQVGDTRDGCLAPLRMPLHPLASLGGQHRHGVHPGVLGQSDHAQVRQHRTEQQLGLLGRSESHFAANRLGKKGHTGAVGKQIPLWRYPSLR